jgi:hypothetical protein
MGIVIRQIAARRDLGRGGYLRRNARRGIIPKVAAAVVALGGIRRTDKREVSGSL